MGQNKRPPVIKNDPAPPGYRITHVHRDNPDQTRGGGLAVIHRDEMNVLLNQKTYRFKKRIYWLNGTKEDK